MPPIAKKYFGQNFLKDTNVLEKIIKSMPETDLNIVEIGPGLGDLTQRLLSKNRVIAYEIDNDLCVYLREKFANALDEKRLILYQGDVLEHWSTKKSLCERPYQLIANLPYYIATDVILKALYDPYCQYIQVMVQKEVAQKFTAKVKTKSFCKLTVLAQNSANASMLFDVPPESFEPSPKVNSAILRLEKRLEFGFKSSCLLANEEKKLAFESYLDIAFSAPRKQWVKNLSKRFDRAMLVSLLEKATIPTQIRPHEIDPAIHHHLFTQLTKVNDYVKRDNKQ